MSAVEGLPVARSNFGHGIAAGASAGAAAPTGTWPVGYLTDQQPSGWNVDPLYPDRFPQAVTDNEGPAGRLEYLDRPQLLPESAIVQWDSYIPAWAGSGYGQTPQQLSIPVGGPVRGNDSDNTSGLTMQPDYWMQGQFGPVDGGGTPMHETVAAYYQQLAEQVVRDYSASAMFAVT